MSSTENLHVNQWIAVTSVYVESEHPWEKGKWHIAAADGRPLQVLAISPPFIAVTDGLQRFPIDTRGVKFTKIHRKYVSELEPAGKVTTVSSGIYVMDEQAARNRDEAEIAEEEDSSGERACPECGTGLVERRIVPDPSWFLACPECGFIGKRL